MPKEHSNENQGRKLTLWGLDRHCSSPSVPPPETGSATPFSGAHFGQQRCLPSSFLLRSPDRLSDSPSGETCEGSCRFRHLLHCHRRRCRPRVPCNFLILSAALAGRAGCGARPSSLPDSCGKTQVRLSGHSKVFSALELRGKSITVKESKRNKAAASFCSG